ncbi:Ankyrin repeat domain-containing protein 29, partial [Geodia barretti]
MLLTFAAKISPLSYLQGGATALHLAAQQGKADVVRLLTEAGAQLDIQRTTGATSLYIASEKGHSEVVNILLRNGAGVDRAKNVSQ